MNFIQRCTAILIGVEAQSRGNMQFMSKEKVQKQQRRAEKAEWKRKMRDMQQGGAPTEQLALVTEDDAAAEPAGPIPTFATLPMDVSFVVPSAPCPVLPAEQAQLCLQCILEDDREAEASSAREDKAQRQSSDLRQDPEVSPEQPSSDDEDQVPESTSPSARCKESQVQKAKLTSKEVPAPDTSMMLVCVQGPHGSLPVAVPTSAAPGTLVRVRIGPTKAFRVTLAAGLEEGQVMALELPSGERMQVAVPPGKKAGDEFDVSPPVIMVQVPSGAEPGTQVTYDHPEGRKFRSRSPTTFETGVRLGEK
eukprot:TRINITY_DN5396_c0_g1_i1.p1 TRINITY_DN5396_c0_g1~~TRINITY_DN5396_c0_g1_i1.p1  ORF type:complete len:307 (+),score=71.40 TRINITY_DN5396_c0_g1_i1:60-980(+)